MHRAETARQGRLRAQNVRYERLDASLGEVKYRYSRDTGRLRVSTEASCGPEAPTPDGSLSCDRKL